MGKFSDVILISDFDHTITDHNDQIPVANIEAVRQFMEQGGIFTVATGRSAMMAWNRLRDFPMNAPLLVYNGAGCYDQHTDTMVFTHPLPADCAALMRRYEQAYPDLRLELQCQRIHYVFHEDPVRDQYLVRQNTPYAYTDWDSITEPVLKISIYSHRDSMFQVQVGSDTAKFFARLRDEIEEAGQGRYTAVNSLPGMVEVQAGGTSKGKSARQLADRLGRTRLVCVGDSANDLTMLREADHAFLPADCDSRMLSFGFPLAAPSSEGTLADVIRCLDALL